MHHRDVQTIGFYSNVSRRGSMTNKMSESFSLLIPPKRVPSSSCLFPCWDALSWCCFPNDLQHVCFHLNQFLYRCGDGLVVGLPPNQRWFHSTFHNGLLVLAQHWGRTLCPDKQNFFLSQPCVKNAKLDQGLGSVTKIDDVDTTLSVDISTHLRVPHTGSVPEMHTGIYKVLGVTGIIHSIFYATTRWNPHWKVK